MAYPTDLSRTIVFKARRDTVLLVVAVTAVTFAMSSAIHSRSPSPGALSAKQDWTGGLAQVAIATPIDVPQPITSASLVVPSSELALPQVPVRALVRLHGCNGSECVPKAGVPVPVRRPAARPTEEVSADTVDVPQTKPNLMSRLNPLNHLADISKISRPFSVAGDTVSGWFKRF